MENKYYTPNLNEFYVGFRCEIKNEAFTQEKFILETCNKFFMKNIRDKINVNSIRVKYLDKEDIKELGWIEVKKGNAYKNDYFVIEKSNDESYELIYHQDTPTDINIFYHNEKGSTKIFDGIIKNYNKLQTLMNELDIGYKNKYYTPTIEEFHVNFRYEYKYEDADINSAENIFGTIWWEKELSLDTLYDVDLGVIEEVIKDDRIRVKYLDEKDIKELGWIKEDKDWYEGTKDRFYLDYEKGSGNWSIGDEENEFGYTGPIKNYNELKNLMKKFNIKNN